MNDLYKAYQLLKKFKGDSYYFGINIVENIPNSFYPSDEKIAIIRSTYFGSNQQIIPHQKMLTAQNEIVAIINGPKPNAPIEDLDRIVQHLKECQPTALVSFGGGSTTDITKAANILYSLGGEIEDYFGIALASQVIHKTNKSLLPHFAIQTAASSSAHLTKYSNITNLKTNQKKLIVDDTIIPYKSIFDYATTISAPKELTLDGALDGLSHSLEVYYGSLEADNRDLIEEVCLESIRLILHYLPLVVKQPENETARTGLAMGVDLGGYAIMLGGTNGGHLTSFSLVDILSHGRACAIMNPYYTVYFSPTIHPQLKKLAKIFIQEDLVNIVTPADTEKLGLFVAQGLQEFMKRIGVPIALKNIPGFNDYHIERALEAAKNPKLRMKLNNMPVPFSAADIDTNMKNILLSALEGDFQRLVSEF